MIDLLYSFPDEATAHRTLDQYELGADGAWDASRCLPVQVIVGQNADGSPVAAGGYWLVVSVPEPRDELYAIPYCMREADRDKAQAGEPYVNRERFTAMQLAAPWQITPQWCGVNYSNAGAAPVTVQEPSPVPNAPAAG